MSWESDERDDALAKLDKIKQLCSWVERRRLPAHRQVIKDINAIIDAPTQYGTADFYPMPGTFRDSDGGHVKPLSERRT